MLQFHRKKPILSSFSRCTIGLFLLGFLPGCIAAQLLDVSLSSAVSSLFSDTITELSWLTIDRNEIFFLSLQRHVRFLLLLFFFSLTNVWRFYYTTATIYTGFCQGLLLGFCILVYGIGGTAQYACFLLPQCVVLAPAFLFIVDKLDIFHSRWFSCESHRRVRFLPFLTTEKRQLLFCQLPFFFFSILLLLLCAVLEGYLNVPLLRAFHLGWK